MRNIKKAAYDKQYYIDNKEVIKNRSKQYYQDNKEAKAAYDKQRYQDNKEELKEKRDSNKEEKKIYMTQYNKDNKEKRDSNKEVKAAYDKQYAIDNKEELKEKHKQYNKEHIEERKQYYQDNKESIAKWSKQYSKDNRAILNAAGARRRAVKLNQTPLLDDNAELTIKILYFICKQWNETSEYKWHVDHIIPLSKGGLHEPHNLQIIPATENLQKHDSLDYEIPRESCFRISDLISLIKDTIEIRR